MRLVTRGDLDGLVSAVLLSRVENIEKIELVHPQHITDNLFEVNPGDILAKLPYHNSCSMWFSHREISESNVNPGRHFKGRHAISTSASRVIYEHYASEALKPFEYLVEGADRIESARLSREDVLNPQGIVLLGFLLDPRTSMGAFKVFFKSLVDRLGKRSLEDVMNDNDVRERIEMYRNAEEDFRRLLSRNTTLIQHLAVTDFRAQEMAPVGNRFMVYAMYPECSVSLRLQWGPKKNFVAATIGKSIFNRTCELNLGAICSDYGGGGHSAAGSCPLDPANAEEDIRQIVARLLEGAD